MKSVVESTLKANLNHLTSLFTSYMKINQKQTITSRVDIGQDNTL